MSMTDAEWEVWEQKRIAIKRARGVLPPIPAVTAPAKVDRMMHRDYMRAWRAGKKTR